MQRIVVYIDDLDRCAEEQVVAVIQAVHLLLAYKCFVVVVAVDAGWLQQSLKTVYRQFSQGENGPSVEDYLEKIFQIPFWVKPMVERGSGGEEALKTYRSFLTSMVGTGDDDRDDKQENNRDGEASITAAISAPSSMSGVFSTLQPLEPFAPEAQDEERKKLGLTPKERDLMLQLGTIAGKSPRAVKRMVNLYRLIRASFGARDLNTFLTGGGAHIPPFAAVQLLLAIEVGFPAEIVPGLLQGIGETWPQTWDEVQQGAQLEPDGPISFADGEPWLGLLTESGRIYDFHQALAQANNATGRDLTCGEFSSAARIVMRYSFHSCRR